MNKLKILSLMIVAGAIIPGAAIAKKKLEGMDIKNFDHVFTQGYESQIRNDRGKTGYRFTYFVANNGEVTLKLRKKNGQKELTNIGDYRINKVSFHCVNEYSNNSHWANYKKVGVVTREDMDSNGKDFSVQWTPEKVGGSDVNHTCVARIRTNRRIGIYDAIFSILNL